MKLLPSLVTAGTLLWFAMAGAASPHQNEQSVDDLLAIVGTRARVVRSTGARAAPRVRFVDFARKRSLLRAWRYDAETLRRGEHPFLQDHARAFGADPASELTFTREQAGADGSRHVLFTQWHRGLPVWNARLALHFASDGSLRAANGDLVHGLRAINVGDVKGRVTFGQIRRHELPVPRLAVQRWAERRVRGWVRASGSLPDPELLIFQPRDHATNHDGDARVAYRVYTAAGRSGRRLPLEAFVDAQNGALLAAYPTIRHADAAGLSRALATGAKADGTLILACDDERPSGSSVPRCSNYTPAEGPEKEALQGATETFDLFARITGSNGVTDTNFNNPLGDALYASFDGNNATMLTMVNVEDVVPDLCPNAFWDPWGAYVGLCNALAVDDVVGHEWTHAYTTYVADLVYAWQPGALDEAMSDIFGELVDQTNGRGLDTPDVVRAMDACSDYTAGARAVVTVDAPASVAGSIRAAKAEFAELDSPVTSHLVLANDAAGANPAEGCATLSGASYQGAIVVALRGTCTFVEKEAAARLAGAAALVVVNVTDNRVFPMSGDEPEGATAIPSVLVGRDDGQKLVGALQNGQGGTVTASVGLSSSSAQEVSTVRWLIGEDTDGVSRDVWNPACMFNPGATNDPDYLCAEVPSDDADNGGVHVNSGVPARAFALLVDGATSAAGSIGGIGRNKAAHIYWRAHVFYHTPYTDFAGHADALRAACTELKESGWQLPDITTGSSSNASITDQDCQALAQVIDAVQLEGTPPCGFEPLLSSEEVTICDDPERPREDIVYGHDFEKSPFSGDNVWAVAHACADSDCTPRDWTWTKEFSDPVVTNGQPVELELPDERDGHALFATNSILIGDCSDEDGDEQADDAQSSERSVYSPVIQADAGLAGLFLSFRHYAATEFAGSPRELWDGGNLELCACSDDTCDDIAALSCHEIPAEAFVANGYPSEIIVSVTPEEGGEAFLNTNPLAGKKAFGGVNPGSHTGSWATSVVDLASIEGVDAGSTTRFLVRFRFGIDECNGIHGWYVDDFKVSRCLVGEPNNDPVDPVDPVDATSPQGGDKQVPTGTVTVTGGPGGCASGGSTGPVSGAWILLLLVLLWAARLRHA